MDSTTGHKDHGASARRPRPAAAVARCHQRTRRLPARPESPLLTRSAGPGTCRSASLTQTAKPLTSFATSHEKQLHLIVVRTDGTEFRHVHPTMDVDGTWSLPWAVGRGGHLPRLRRLRPRQPTRAARPSRLTRTVEVAGQFTPATPAADQHRDVDGYTVNLAGELTAGSSSELTFTVSKNGKPVTTLEPYLGAFGHLVALRDGRPGLPARPPRRRRARQADHRRAGRRVHRRGCPPRAATCCTWTSRSTGRSTAPRSSSTPPAPPPTRPATPTPPTRTTTPPPTPRPTRIRIPTRAPSPATVTTH